jgi:hypothetical protein
MAENASNVLRILDDDTSGALTPHFEKLEELSILYNERAVNWNEAQFDAARICTQAIVKSLVSSTLHFLRSKREPDQEYRDALRSLVEVAKRTGQSNLGDASAFDFAGFVQESSAALPFWAAAEQERLVSGLRYIDRMSYENGVEADQASLRKIVAEVSAAVRDSRTGKELDRAVALGTKIFSHLFEQVPSILRAPVRSTLSQSIERLMVTKGARDQFDTAKAVKFDIMERQELHKLLNTLVPRLRMARDAGSYRESSLLLWYVLRNSCAHSEASLEVQQFQADMSNAFIHAMSAAVDTALTKAPYSQPALVKIAEVVGEGTAHVQHTGRSGVLALSQNGPLAVGQVWMGRRTDSAEPSANLWWLEKPATLDILSTIGEEALKEAPRDLVMGVKGISRAPAQNPEWRSTLNVFRARKGPRGNTIASYGPAGIAPVDYPRPFQGDADAELQVEIMGRDLHFFIGWVMRLQTGVVLVPISSAVRVEVVESLAKQLGIRYTAVNIRA